MTLKTICICGPRASTKVVGGLGLAFELLLKELDRRKIAYEHVNVLPRGEVSRTGEFSFLRVIENFLIVLRVWGALLCCRIYYTNMSTSFAGFFRDYLTVLGAKILSRKIVLHLHGGGFQDFYRSQNAFVQNQIVANLRRADAIIVLGGLLKEQFSELGCDVFSKVEIIPNGLSIGVHEPRWKARRLQDLMRVETINLLYMSSLMESKGYLDSIDAMIKLRLSSAKHFHLDLCGDFVSTTTDSSSTFSKFSDLQDYIARKGLSGMVTVHGQVLGQLKCEMFEKAHIFLLPTLYPWEGQPLSIIEALAFGLPVVSCHHRGIPEQVVDKENGCLVDKTPEAIAEAVKFLTSDHDKYVCFSRRSRQIYERKFKRDVHLSSLFRAIGIER